MDEKSQLETGTKDLTSGYNINFTYATQTTQFTSRDAESDPQRVSPSVCPIILLRPLPNENWNLTFEAKPAWEGMLGDTNWSHCPGEQFSQGTYFLPHRMSPRSVM